MEKSKWNAKHLENSLRSRSMIKVRGLKRRSKFFIQLRTHWKTLCNFWKSTIQELTRDWAWIEHLQKIDQQTRYNFNLGPMEELLWLSEENQGTSFGFLIYENDDRPILSLE